MLVRDFPFLDPRGITPDMSSRLQALTEDCVLLAQGLAAIEDKVRAAPILDLYTPVISPLGLQLAGTVMGHPLLGSRVIVTSQVWFADPEDRWVRTLSRFYRLARRGPDTQLSKLNGNVH